MTPAARTRRPVRRLVSALGALALLLAAGCSPRAASSESTTPSTSPPTISFEALGQTTTTPPPAVPAATVAVTTAPAADPGAVTAAASEGDGTVSAAGATAHATETTIQMSVITPPPPVLPPPPPLTIGAPRPDGTVPVVIEPSVTRFAVRYRDNGGDPYYQVRTTTEVPFLFDVELYTKSGVGWTGELGTFATDCELNGICVYLRLAAPSDGHGVAPVAMAAEPLGRVTIGRLTSGVQLHLQQLRFRALGTSDVYAVDDLMLDLVPPS